HFEITLAGDAERHLDAVRAQRRDDELAAAQFGQVGRHFLSPVAPAPLLWAEAAVRRKRVVGAELRQAGISAIAPRASRKMRSCGTTRRSASSRFIPAKRPRSTRVTTPWATAMTGSGPRSARKAAMRP